ncbi:MAG: BCCT family transporter, partial [Pseudomonadales bacterium]|nr:BCCT family transporter [Pseudomonadales bacterium]
GFFMQLVIVSLVTATIAYSVYRGLDDGIKVLSIINAVLALILITFVLLIGPTRFILEMGIVSVGHMLQNFIKMTTWADPLQRSAFVESWTVFYWAWWIALGPFVGMFVCKISEGRTVREVIFGMLGWGSLGCALFFIVLGNYAYFLETTGVLPVIQETTEVSPSAAIASMMTTLPMGTFWLIFLAVIGLVSSATTYDSASYTLAAGATKNLTEHAHPARWHRVFWALSLGVLPACLLYLGDIRVLQTASVVASLPILGVYVLMSISIIKTLNAHADGKI